MTKGARFLAPVPIIVKIGAERVELRPTLRAAIRIDDLADDPKRILQEIVDGKLTTYCEILSIFTDADDLESIVWNAGLDNLRGPLVAFVLALLGFDEDQPEGLPKNGDTPPDPTETYSEYLRRLYRCGTGWLGWTSEQTLETSPRCLAEAQRGRVEMLNAVYGDPEASKPKPPLDARFRALFAGVGTKVHRKAKEAA